jgi:hypothetical protein
LKLIATSAVPPPDHETFYVILAGDSRRERLLSRAAFAQASHLHIVAEAAGNAEVAVCLSGLIRLLKRREYLRAELQLHNLNMPFNDGFEVLAWLQNPEVQNHSVTVLTDSGQFESIRRVLQLPLADDCFQMQPGPRPARHGVFLALEEYLLKQSSSRAVASPVRHSFPAAGAHAFSFVGQSSRPACRPAPKASGPANRFS